MALALTYHLRRRKTANTSSQPPLSGDECGFLGGILGRGAIGAALRFQEIGDFGIGPRLAEQEALSLMAALRAQAAATRLRFRRLRR